MKYMYVKPQRAHYSTHMHLKLHGGKYNKQYCKVDDQMSHQNRVKPQ